MPQIKVKSTALSPRSFSATFVRRGPRDERQDSDHHSPLPQVRNEHKPSRTEGRDHSVQQFTDIPPPIPDSGPLSLSYSRTTLLPYFLSSRSSSFMTLHSLTSAPATLTVTNQPLQLSESVLPTIRPSNSPSPNSFQRQTPNPSKISVPVIASIAVGISLFIVAGIIFLRVCKRPRPRERPKPSLPILDNSFNEEDMCKSSESPLFGGQERFSTNNGNNGGLWAWTQYPQVKPTQVPTVRLFPPPPPKSLEPENRPCSPPLATERSRGLLAPRPPPSQSVPTLGPSLLSVSSTHQVKETDSATTLHRLSIRSLSLYPNSPMCSGKEANFSAGRLSRSNELSKDVEGSSHDIAYDGADITSPQFFAQDLIEEPPSSTNPSGSRSRIKSSYFSYTPGSYPRMSSVQSGMAALKTHDDDFDLRKLPPIHKSDSHLAREKALAAALGVTSPNTVYTAPLSPPATLYPDYPLSPVDANRTSRRLHRKPTPNSRLKRKSYLETGAPGTRTSLDSGTTLGGLMLMDFGARSKSSGMLSDNNYTSDRPPRVPSPPPLPSLAQMGLEHANPEGYGEYRSATYSICGLYEGDRKSRMG